MPFTIWSPSPRIVRPLILLVAGVLSAFAADSRWEKLTAFGQEVAAAQGRIHAIDDLVVALGEQVTPGTDPVLDAARAQVKQAEAALKVARTAAGLDPVEAAYAQAAADRDAKAEALLGGLEPYRQLLEQLAKARATGTDLLSRVASLDHEGLLRLATARQQEKQVDGQLYRLRKACWRRAEVGVAHDQADAHYKKLGSLAKAKPVAEAEAAARSARAALTAAVRTAGEASPAAATIRAGLGQLQQTMKERQAELEAVRKNLSGTWTTHQVSIPLPSAADPGAGEAGKADEAKKRPLPKPATARIEIPTGCQQVRGALVWFMGTAQGIPQVRSVLTENNFALITMEGIGVFNKPADRALFLTCLAQLATASRHPEVAHVPWLTAGCSTTVLTARNIAAWKPERTIGVIHWAGGNLQEHPKDLPWSLTGIPLLAINGELEWCGPVGGIRPEYGRQTQWVMIREQLLRLRAQDPAHLISLVVIPGGDHAGWAEAVSPITALFVRKAIAARLPKPSETLKSGEVLKPSETLAAPVLCRPVAPESGWLTDADLTEPKIAAAAATAYAGPAAKAFWHFDQEIATAITDFHRGRFILPDPTRQHPVPADWPPAESR